MNRHDNDPGSEPRRGFLRRLLLTVAAAVGFAALGGDRPDPPRDKDLREADFYKKHDLAG